MALFGKKDETFADLVDRKPKLLSGEFSFCSHPTGFWAGQNTKVSDDSGTYLRMTGDCKKCNKPVFVIRELAQVPA